MTTSFFVASPLSCGVTRKDQKHIKSFRTEWTDRYAGKTLLLILLESLPSFTHPLPNWPARLPKSHWHYFPYIFSFIVFALFNQEHDNSSALMSRWKRQKMRSAPTISIASETRMILFAHMLVPNATEEIARGSLPFFVLLSSTFLEFPCCTVYSLYRNNPNQLLWALPRK